MNDLVTIDLKPIILAQDEAGKFLITKEAEQQVITILEAEKLIKEIVKAVKDKLKILMTEKNTLKVEGARAIALLMFHGERYEVFDRDLALQGGFAIEETKVKPNIDVIDDFVKLNPDKLPKGIKLRERDDSVTLKLRKEENERPE